MLDLITLIKPDLSEDEIAAVVERNGLQTNSKDGLVFYDNLNIKNLAQQKGVLIRVETNRKLKVECSLQKFFNETIGAGRINFNMFTMSQAQEAIDRLLAEKGVGIADLRVYHYEIGMNLNVSKDCRSYLDKMREVAAAGREKEIDANRKYKDRRDKTTLFHRHTRKIFKAYDKVAELKDKKRKRIPDGHILRIETAYRRLDDCFVVDFFHPDNLKKMIETFYRDWRTIQFKQNILTPKGTGRARQRLCLDIIEKGADKVLQEAKEGHKDGSLTDWEYRNIREFVTREWSTFKKDIVFIQSEEELEFRKLLKENYTLLKHDEII